MGAILNIFFVFNDENINLESYNNVKSKFPSNSSYILYDLAILYNQEQKKKQQQTNKQKNATLSKSIFSYLYLSKYTLLCIKLNTIGWTSWWWKLYLKIFYNEHFILLWNRPSKNTSHKKRHIQGKRRLLITF